MIKLLLILLAFAVISEVGASERINDIYAVSDSQINDFLQKFIESSVANVTMLVEFVTKMLKDAIGSNTVLPALSGDLTK
jgi:hypothetical protein